MTAGGAIPGQAAPQAVTSTSASASGAAFHRQHDQAAFLRGWAVALAQAQPGLRRIVVLAEDATGSAFRPIAVWPDPAADIAALAPVIAAAVQRGEGVVEPAAADPAAFARAAFPLFFETELAAIVAAEAVTPPAALARALETGAGWLAARLWEARARDAGARHADGVAALDILAVLAGQRRAPDAAAALVNELVSRFDLSRAVLALARDSPGRGARLRLAAVSRAAWFRRRGPLARAFENAMEEALDQLDTVQLPAPAGARPVVDAAHAALQQASGAPALASVVLYDDDRPVGALTVEAPAPLADATLRRIEAIAALAGPVLALKRRQQAWIAGRGPDLAGQGLRALFGRNRPSYRLAAVLLLAVAVAPFVLTGPLRITTDAVLEGATQQAAVAPVSGFVAEAPHRAGDVVAQGALLLRLDDRDLRLEAERWRSELAQLRQQERRALAATDRAETALIAAQIAQAQAQMALAAARLERTRILAPVGGVILSGDFTGRIGAPVELGDLLFEIAPPGEVRVRLEVDERDVALLDPGQAGALTLAARPSERLALELTAVVPVARADAGGTHFRAEARLTDPPPDLLPGMEGVARLTVAQAPWAAILTRRLRDWAGLFLWRWMP